MVRLQSLGGYELGIVRHEPFKRLGGSHQGVLSENDVGSSVEGEDWVGSQLEDSCGTVELCDVHCTNVQFNVVR